MNPGRENKVLFGLRESLCDVGHSHVEKLSRFRSISGAVKYVIIVYSMKTYVKRRKIIVRWGLWNKFSDKHCNDVQNLNLKKGFWRV